MLGKQEAGQNFFRLLLPSCLIGYPLSRVHTRSYFFFSFSFVCISAERSPIREWRNFSRTEWSNRSGNWKSYIRNFSIRTEQFSVSSSSNNGCCRCCCRWWWYYERGKSGGETEPISFYSNFHCYNECCNIQWT